MLFYLTILNLANFLTEDAPKSNDECNAQTLTIMDAWKNSDYLCQNYDINNLANSLYHVYSSKKIIKELLEFVDKKI